MQILVIARLKPGSPLEKVGPLVPAESLAVWKMYAAGVVRNAYYLAEGLGAVLLVEAESLDPIRKWSEDLPLAEAGYLDLEYIPLKPYTGFENIVREA